MSYAKTESEKKLDEVVEGLKGQGFVAVYCLARYDCGTGSDAHFSTRVSYPDGADPDAAVRAAVVADPDDGWSGVFDLDRAVAALATEGWSVWAAVGTVGGHPRRVCKLNTGPGWPSQAHQEMDVVREIAVAWSNARHTSQLVWKE